MRTLDNIVRQLVVVALSLGLAAGALAKPVTITPKARRLFDTGIELMEDPEGPRYEEAYRAFKAAYEDSPTPLILGNLGLCATKLERDGEAIEAYERYLAEAPDIDPEERQQVERDLRILRANGARLVLNDVPAGAIVTDERTPARGAPIRNRYGPLEAGRFETVVRAGNHRVHVEHPDHGKQEMLLELPAGQSREARIKFAKRATEPGETPGSAARMPVPYVLRPITLPELTLSPALGVRYGRRAYSDGSSNPTAGVDLLVAAFGITDDFQVELQPLPIEILPEPDYGTAFGGARYRFLDAVVELAGSVRVGVTNTGDEHLAFLDLGVLEALGHVDTWGRVDTGFVLTFLFTDPVLIGMRVPLAFAVQPVELWHIGLTTGVGIWDFQDAAETTYVPVGAFTGVAIPRDEEPLLDIGVHFAFDELFVPGDDRAVRPNAYTGALWLRLYFYL